MVWMIGMFKSCCAHAMELIALARKSNKVDLVRIVIMIGFNAKVMLSSVNGGVRNIKNLF